MFTVFLSGVIHSYLCYVFVLQFIVFLMLEVKIFSNTYLKVRLNGHTQ